MNFIDAIKAMYDGKTIRRSSSYYIRPNRFRKDASGVWINDWLAGESDEIFMVEDIIAEDWELVE